MLQSTAGQAVKAAQGMIAVNILFLFWIKLLLGSD